MPPGKSFTISQPNSSAFAISVKLPQPGDQSTFLLLQANAISSLRTGVTTKLAPHQHFHTQATYCISGKFEFDIDGEKKVIEAGDGVYIEPNLLHSAVCLEEGMLIDTFSPVREDFLSGGAVSYFGDNKK